MSNTFISKLNSFALVTIALLAVIVSVWQVNHQRKHDRLSLMPYISWNVESEGDTAIIKIWNKGAGPALITDYTFHINDSTFGAWAPGFAYADTTIIPLNSVTFGTYTLAAGERLMLVSYKKGVKKDGNLAIDIIFESVYGDKKEDYLKTNL